MDYSDIIVKLKSMRNENNIAGMARFGITGKVVLGISIYVLRDFAKAIKKQMADSESVHKLALKLWQSGIHEARHLAVFLDDPVLVTESQMESWALDFESWDDTDQACTSLFDKTKFAWKKVFIWAVSDREFVKRGAFSLIAGLAVHDKQAVDGDFIKLFSLIENASVDERNFLKNAVSWALRNIGKRNVSLNKLAVKLAVKLSNSTSKSAKWIGKDALRELTSEKVLARF